VRISSQPTEVKRTVWKETETADGRDLSKEEFRRIPEFPDYEITKDGDLRSLRSGYLLLETQRPGTDLWYFKLVRPDGRQTNRSWQKLVWLAFPELKPTPKVVEAPKGREEKSHCRRGHEYNEENTLIDKRGYRNCRKCHNQRARERRKEAAVADDGSTVGHKVWRVAHNFPLYEVNKKGAVREINTGRLLTISRNNRGRYYHLRKGKQVVAVQRKFLINSTFPKADAA